MREGEEDDGGSPRQEHHEIPLCLSVFMNKPFSSCCSTFFFSRVLSNFQSPEMAVCSFVQFIFAFWVKDLLSSSMCHSWNLSLGTLFYRMIFMALIESFCISLYFYSLPLFLLFSLLFLIFSPAAFILYVMNFIGGFLCFLYSWDKIFFDYNFLHPLIHMIVFNNLIFIFPLMFLLKQSCICLNVSEN